MARPLRADKDLSEIPMKQRRAPPKPLHHDSTSFEDRDEAIAAAYASGGYSMKKIGEHFDLHYSYVSRIISRVEKARGKKARGKT